MGRSPCCSKVGLNRGVWTSSEDKILFDYIQLHGEGRWRNLPKRAGLKRCGKSCRLRWLNYLRPDIKRGNISADEEDLIVRLHKLLGNRWSLIAGRLPGRTDNEIKNYWNTTLRKKTRDHHIASDSSTLKTMKNKHKKKRQSTQDTQTLELLITSPKPDDHNTMSHSKVGSHENKMNPDSSPPQSPIDIGSSKSNEAVIEQILNLEPHIDSSNICSTGLLSPDVSSLFATDIHDHAENEIMEMLEELWSAENMIIEPHLGSPTDLHFCSTSDCIGDWLL